MLASIRSFLRDDGLVASFIAAVALGTIIADPIGVALVRAFRGVVYVLIEVTKN